MENRAGDPSNESLQAKLNLRMTDALRGRIETAATARGISMNAEIIERLERSFRAAEAFDDALKLRYGTHGALLLQLIGAAILGRAGRGPLADLDTAWINDERARSEIETDVMLLFDWLPPRAARAPLNSSKVAGSYIAALAGLHPSRGKSWDEWMARLRALAGPQLIAGIEHAHVEDMWRKAPPSPDNEITEDQLTEIQGEIDNIWIDAQAIALSLHGRSDLAELLRLAKDRYDALDDQISALASSPSDEGESSSAEMTRLVTERGRVERDWIAALIAIDKETAQEEWFKAKFLSDDDEEG